MKTAKYFSGLAAMFLVVVAFMDAQAIPNLNTSGSLCVGNTIRVTVAPVTGCTGIKVTSQSNWDTSGASSVTYIGSSGHWNAVDVVYNSPGIVSVSVSYSCNSGPGNEESVTFTVGAPITPTVSPSLSANNSCGGFSTTIYANPTNQGTNPAFAYFVGGTQIYSGSASSVNYSTSGLSPGTYTVAVTMVNQNAGCFTPSATANGSTTLTVYASPYQGSLVVNNGVTSGCIGLPIPVSLTGNSGTAYYNIYYLHDGNTVNVESASNLGTSFSYTPTDYGTWTFETWSQTICGNSNHVSFSVSVWAPPGAPSISSVNPVCKGSAVTLHATADIPGRQVRWFASSDLNQPPINTYPYGDVSSGALNTTTTFYAASFQVISPTAGCDGTRYPVTITVRDPQVGSIGHASTCGNDALLVGTANAPGSLTSNVLWYDAATGGNLIGGSPSHTNITSSTTFYAAGTATYQNNLQCEQATRQAVPVTWYPVPSAPTNVTGDLLYTGGTANLSATPGSDATAVACSINWYNNAGDPSPFQNSNSYSPAVTGTTTYYIATYNPTSGCESTPRASVTATVKNLNSVTTTIVQIPNATALSTVPTLNYNQAIRQTTYFDGLIRPIQTVSKQASPMHYDLNAPITYDNLGRESKKYLPFAAQQTGQFKITESIIDGSGNYTGTAGSFYSTSTDNLPDDAKPYSQTIYETTPLSRVLKNGGAGTMWQPDGVNSYNSTDHTVKFSYETNSANEVLKWSYTRYTPQNPMGLVSAGTAASPVYYPAGVLTKNKTKDENGNEVIEYVNVEGKTVLKRVQATSSTTITDTNYASTYYIYDEFLNLVCVIPPEATKRLATEFFQAGATDATKEAFLKRWAFRYRYDARARMMLKQVPGADSVKMVYDNRDRLVLTQDGNQRQASIWYWTFTKYDVLNRPILTGIRDTAVNCTQIQMQNVVNTHYAKSTLNQYETYVGSATGNVHGYSNKSYPARTGGATEIDPNKYLTVTYYDNYSFRSLWTGTYTYLNESLSETVGSVTYSQPAVENTYLRGQATGTKIKVLDAGVTGGANWLKSVNYYDDKYRVIQTLSDNYKGGTDRISNVYDFTGKILKSKATHVEADVTWKDMVGAGLIGNSLTRTASGGTWGTSGAASYQTLPAGVDGWMELTVSVDGSKMIGLSDVNVDAHYFNIDYALYLGGLTLYVYENGTMKYNSTTTLVPGEVLRINRTGTTITYLRNGTVFYTSLTSSATSLLVDNAILNQNATLTNVRTSFGSTSHVVTRRFVYDHAGRLLKVRHQLDANPEILLIQNDYNEIGQLVDKKLHSTNNGSTFRQSVDMRYNIRGWLKSMNNSQLTNDSGVTNDDANDLFGMELGYDNNIGTSNSPLYNGNISGMKWSTNLALGTVKDVGYNYSYDPMNRILGASYLKNTAGAWANAASAFSESGYSYDMNGNILGLTRKDGTGTNMDALSYDYGTTVSNQLLKVSDTGDKTKGFIEPSSTTGNDYSYDANGNMTVDQNKGITAITYNYLNLPVQVTKGTNKINYYYDASGKKVSQLVTYTSFQKKSDYMGEYFYENDTLRFINTEEGRVIMSNPVAQDALVAAYMLDGNANDQSGNGLSGTLNGGAVATTNRNGESGKALLLDGTDDYVNIPNNAAFNFGSNNFTVSFWVKKLATTVNWDNGIGVCKWNTGASPGTNSWTVGLGGQNDNFPGFSIESFNTIYQVNGTTALNIGTWYFLQATRQGNLLKLYVNGVLEGVTTLPSATTVVNTTTLPVYVGRLPQGLYTNAVFDEIQIIHETTSNSSSPYEYQYNLKDHLGNVRLTFTTVNSTDQATGTLEDANLTSEQSKFLRYSDAKRVNSILFDHTNGASTGYAERLNGTSNEKFGIARSLSVMPGDTLKLEVYGKYVNSDSTTWINALPGLMANVRSHAAGVVVDGVNYATSTASFPFAGLINTSGSTGGPKAYLNWAVFDRDFNFISAQSGYTRMSATPNERGQDVAHEKLSSPNIIIAQPGYVYTWVSNENPTPVEVYFDDLKVTLGKSPVIQQEDYYPFGLSFNEYQRENSVLNNYQYNGKEKQDELGLGWLDYGARMYMPEIGRWGVVDRRGDLIQEYSSYAYCLNDPIIVVDRNGEIPIPLITGAIGAIGGVLYGVLTNKSGKEILALGGAGFVAGATLGLGTVAVGAAGGAAAIGTTNAAYIMGTASVASTMAGNLAKQSIDNLTNQKSGFSEREFTIAISLALPEALFGSLGNTASSGIKNALAKDILAGMSQVERQAMVNGLAQDLLILAGGRLTKKEAEKTAARLISRAVESGERDARLTVYITRKVVDVTQITIEQGVGELGEHAFEEMEAKVKAQQKTNSTENFLNSAGAGNVAEGHYEWNGERWVKQ